MRRNILFATVAVLLSVVPSQAATSIYFVEPKELQEGKVPGDQQHGVRQSFRANVDSIYYIEWFVGDLSAPGLYKFDIIEKVSGQLICWGAESVPANGWKWIRCDDFDGDLHLRKGLDWG